MHHKINFRVSSHLQTKADESDGAVCASLPPHEILHSVSLSSGPNRLSTKPTYRVRHKVGLLQHYYNLGCQLSLYKCYTCIVILFDKENTTQIRGTKN